MNTRLIALLIASACLTACSSNQPAAAAAPSAAPATPAVTLPAPISPPPAASAKDAVAAKLAELAGSGATDCGRTKALSGPEMQAAADCAMKAAKAKHAFTVAYDMPGLTVGIAGNAQGKMFSLSATPDASGAVPAASLKPLDCPAELRVAQSGRVTCVPAGAMGMGSSGANPHGGASPHGSMPPAMPGTPNPHATPPPKTETPTKTQ
jgi:hypothetical protein